MLNFDVVDFHDTPLFLTVCHSALSLISPHGLHVNPAHAKWNTRTGSPQWAQKITRPFSPARVRELIGVFCIIRPRFLVFIVNKFSEN